MELYVRKIRICLWLLVGNILFIWGNSMLPGSISGAISGWLRDLLANIMSGGMGTVSGGDGLLRKLAHIAEFACLGSLLMWLLMLVRKKWILALPAGVVVACIDELIQRFVPMRHAAVRDVLIDTVGVLMGIAILSSGKAIIKYIQRK